MSSGVMAAAGEESPLSESDINRLRRSFDKMMKTLFKEGGASLRIEILEEEPVLNFIDTHASVLDSAFAQTEMSDTMRARLQQSDWIFSGMKTFHELNEAFPSLVDDKGERKSFEQFLNDVRSIDEKYNRNYLRAEYNFANASASMAGRWESFADDDDYLLEYRTAGDDKVRPEHAEMAGIKLPKSDTFWNIYYPPNGWNCRCTVVEVLRATNTPTNSEEAFDRAKSALRGDKKGMFRFNPGKEQKTFPDYNPYTISHCKNCDLAKGKMSLAKPLNCDECRACSIIRGSQKIQNIKLYESLVKNKDYRNVYLDEKSYGIMAIHKQHLQSSDGEQIILKGFTGKDLEIECMSIICVKGGSCILEKEKVRLGGKWLACLDATILGNKMDIASITQNNKNTVFNTITRKEEQLLAYNSAFKENAHHLALYFHEADMFNIADVKSAFMRYSKHPNYEHAIDTIICIVNDDSTDIMTIK